MGSPKNEMEAIKLKSISHDAQKTKSSEKVSKFPWENWVIDRKEDDEKEQENVSKHRQRRSSLGSVREFHNARNKRAGMKVSVAPTKNENIDNISGKKGGGHRSAKKKSLKKKKKHHN